MGYWPGPAVAVLLLAQTGVATADALQHSVLDRVAIAVDGAESSDGRDLAMWRLDPSGPQGPMQVSAAAASDVGVGDRFVAVENRAIGRAYLEQLYRRYHSWPDAIAAYNWGIGRVNAWLAAGRPPQKLAKGVAAYTDRVLRQSGLCGTAARPPVHLATSRHAAGRRAKVENEVRNTVACGEFAGSGASNDSNGTRWRNDNRLLVGLLPSDFDRELENLRQQTVRDLRAAERRLRIGAAPPDFPREAASSPGS